MRCVNKGTPPGIYSYYKDARNDLAGRIGWICCYCEMPVKNMIEVEHVHPVSNGGDPVGWDNFLLSCRYCNGIKLDRNLNRTGYLWPDTDNTILAFDYSELDIVTPAAGLPGHISDMAKNTIDLMGLSRHPGSVNKPTDADSRWINRLLAWGVIHESYNDWISNKTAAFARQIARTALGHGFYSYWIKQFHAEPFVLDEINLLFPGTYKPQYNAAGILTTRNNGSF